MENYDNLTNAQKNKIRKAFKEQRTKLVWSQRGVANIVGITAATYCDIENGKTWTSEKTLDALFEAFGLDASSFTDSEKKAEITNNECVDYPQLTSYQVIVPEQDGYIVTQYKAKDELDALAQFNVEHPIKTSNSFRIYKQTTNS